jgi:TorA-specific chaperone
MNPPEQLAPNARSCMYRLLASLYARELTEENIMGFQEEGPGRKLLDTLETDAAYAPVARFLKNTFAKIADPKQAALDMAESYTWNFHGAGGPHAAPLYASVYLSEKGSTHRKIERDLHKILLEHGLSSVNYEKEPCDHLGVILEFVSCLDEENGTDQQQEAWQETRKLIIEKYLLTWLPKFVAQCKQGDRFGFYSALAEETLSLVEADFQQIRQ